MSQECSCSIENICDQMTNLDRKLNTLNGVFDNFVVNKGAEDKKNREILGSIKEYIKNIDEYISVLGKLISDVIDEGSEKDNEIDKLIGIIEYNTGKNEDRISNLESKLNILKNTLDNYSKILDDYDRAVDNVLKTSSNNYKLINNNYKLISGNCELISNNISKIDKITEYLELPWYKKITKGQRKKFLEV